MGGVFFSRIRIGDLSLGSWLQLVPGCMKGVPIPIYIYIYIYLVGIGRVHRTLKSLLAIFSF